MEKVIILVLSILCFACNANASIERSKKALAYLNCPDHQIEHIANVLSKIPNKDPVLIVTIMSTEESTFNFNKVHSDGKHFSLMGTKTKPKNVTQAIRDGCEDLQQKIKLANGDLGLALTWYKGSKRKYDRRGKPTRGYIQAREVMMLYKQVKKNIG